MHEALTRWLILGMLIGFILGVVHAWCQRTYHYGPLANHPLVRHLPLADDDDVYDWADDEVSA